MRRELRSGHETRDLRSGYETRDLRSGHETRNLRYEHETRDLRALTMPANPPGEKPLLGEVGRAGTCTWPGG